MDKVILSHSKNHLVLFDPNDNYLIDNQSLYFYKEKVYDNHLPGGVGFWFQGIYLNGKREGNWIYWYGNGQQRAKGNFSQGKAEGHWVTWHENGQKRSDGNYSQDKKEGLLIIWDENGQKRSESNYSQGIKESLWSHWYKKWTKSF